MTTIATDGKSMAGDGLVTGNDCVHATDFRKVFRLKDGRIVGFSGSAYHYSGFINWLESGGEVPSMDEHFEALVLNLDGSVLSYDQLCRSIVQPTPAATGSGTPFALGAMDAGASPEVAVGIACKRNPSTGGQIIVEAL